MKKFFVLLTLVSVLLVTAAVGAVIAAPDGLAGKKPIKAIQVDMSIPQKPDSTPIANGRIIVPTPNLLNKVSYWIKGCKSTQKMNDSAAYECSPKIAEKLIAGGEAREDRIFQITDLEADIQIGANDVWTQGIDGAGVNVAVLDTGIDMEHPELNDSYISGYDYVDSDGIPEDWHGHGTHVSGIITADGEDVNAKGVAPSAGIYMYKVCGTYGCPESYMIAAMEAAVLTDAKVMSISIGGGNFVGENCDSDPLAAIVNWVAGHGITVVVASGNDGFFVSSPACASGAIAVGAVDKSGLMADFSNFGPALDIVAPGVSIYSSIINGYASWGGTSMATPHVSGTIALMLEANPDLTVNEIKTALYETAVPINDDSVCYGVVKQRDTRYWVGAVPCSSYNYGTGIVDAYGAVSAVIPEEATCTYNSDCNDSVACTDDSCVSGFCDYSPNDTHCSVDGWFDTVETQWISTGQCTEKEQKKQEYRNYYCDAVLDCQYNITDTKWVDTGNERHKIDETSCEDGLFCTENDYCSGGICQTGATAKTCDDGEVCTDDSCNKDLDICEYIWPNCGISDGCCGPLCSDVDDIDCKDCSGCFKQVCDGKCNPSKEGSDCPDCW